MIAPMMSPHRKVYYQSGATGRVAGPSFPTWHKVYLGHMTARIDTRLHNPQTRQPFSQLLVIKHSKHSISAYNSLDVCILPTYIPDTISHSSSNSRCQSLSSFMPGNGSEQWLEGSFPALTGSLHALRTTTTTTTRCI